MFSFSPLHPSAPKPVGLLFYLPPHMVNGAVFIKAELREDSFKWRAVIPRHFNNVRDICGREHYLGNKVSNLFAGFTYDIEFWFYIGKDANSNQ